MFAAGIAILYAWIAAMIAGIYAFFKWTLRFFGKQAGTNRHHNEPTA